MKQQKKDRRASGTSLVECLDQVVFRSRGQSLSIRRWSGLPGELCSTKFVEKVCLHFEASAMTGCVEKIFPGKEPPS